MSRRGPGATRTRRLIWESPVCKRGNLAIRIRNRVRLCTNLRVEGGVRPPSPAGRVSWSVFGLGLPVIRVAGAVIGSDARRSPQFGGKVPCSLTDERDRLIMWVEGCGASAPHQPAWQGRVLDP